MVDTMRINKILHRYNCEAVNIINTTIRIRGTPLCVVNITVTCMHIACIASEKQSITIWQIASDQ